MLKLDNFQKHRFSFFCDGADWNLNGAEFLDFVWFFVPDLLWTPYLTCYMTRNRFAKIFLKHFFMSWGHSAQLCEIEKSQDLFVLRSAEYLTQVTFLTFLCSFLRPWVEPENALEMGLFGFSWKPRFYFPPHKFICLWGRKILICVAFFVFFSNSAKSLLFIKYSGAYKKLSFVPARFIRTFNVIFEVNCVLPRRS